MNIQKGSATCMHDALSQKAITTRPEKQHVHIGYEQINQLQIPY